MAKKAEATTVPEENGRVEEATSALDELIRETEALKAALDESLYYEVRAWRMLYETQHLRFAPPSVPMEGEET